MTQLNAKELQALQLVRTGTMGRLTDLGNTLVSRQAKRLRELGMIREAPERWIAYEPTPLGKATLEREAISVSLHLAGWHALSVSVASVDYASKVVTDWQDEQGMGASDMGAEHGQVRQGRRIVARTAYNGRILPCSE